jgi:outer membrane protein
MKMIKLFFLFVSISSFAQSKVGTIDIDFIITKMPEITNVQKQLEDYKAELDLDFNKNMDVYNALIKTYTDNEVTFTIAVKKQKQDEIVAAENDLGKFQQNGTKLMSIRRDALLQPLYQKIGSALGKVAEENAYTQVFQIEENLVYLDDKFDLTIQVLKVLGVEIEPKD